MESGLKPGQQARLRMPQVHIRNANLGESKGTSPGRQLPGHFVQNVLTLSHPPILETRDLLWPDEAACAAFAGELARQPQVRHGIIELHGPLGAGKTTFVRHLLRALGISGRIKSPTYAVVEPHDGIDGDGLPLAISHFDFYRFTDPREWEDAGFRDLFSAPGLKLCEWPEKAYPLLPVPDLRLSIEPQDDEQRAVRAEALTEAGRQWLG